MAKGDLYRLASETRRFLELRETAVEPDEVARTLIGTKDYPGVLNISIYSRFVGNTKEFEVSSAGYNTSEETLSAWLAKKDWINQKGSDSYSEFIEKIVSIEVEKIKGYKGPKTTKPNTSANSVELTNKTVQKPRKSRVNVIELLNRKLPDEIRKRMTYPRLVYRTGRFANSAKVLSYTETEKGGTSFSYTYQKNPYQLFEPGRSHLATPERNPRTIIDQSIRAIAAQIMQGRFYTRRL